MATKQLNSVAKSWSVSKIPYFTNSHMSLVRSHGICRTPIAVQTFFLHFEGMYENAKILQSSPPPPQPSDAEEPCARRAAASQLPGLQ